MKERHTGRIGRSVSEIGFGAWAIGGSWGEVDEKDAVASLNAALDVGVTFINWWLRSYFAKFAFLKAPSSSPATPAA